MTDQEIIEFMDWPNVQPEWLREGRSSIWGRTRLLVDEAQRRERARLLGDLDARGGPACALLRPHEPS